MTSPAIVVLGAGYAGLTFTRTLIELGLDPAELLLIDRTPAHQLVIQLHEAAAFTTPPERLAVPLDRVGAGAQLRIADVLNIDLDAKTVVTSTGPVPYRRLVIALGSEVGGFGIPGINEYAFVLRWLADADRLRQHLAMLANGLAAAAENERDAWQTIVIGGGGATGVQLAGEIADWLEHDWNRPAGGRVILLEALEGLLLRFQPDLGREAARALRAKGVDVRLNERIVAAEPASVSMSDGSSIATHTFIWAGGIRLPGAVAKLDLPRRGGSLAADAYLHPEGRPEVTIIGDCVSLLDSSTHQPYPASAQLAVQAARAAAVNLAREFSHRAPKPFRAAYLGEAVSVGRNEAVARVGPITLRGFAGLAVKRYIEQRYVTSIGGVALLKEWGERRQA